MKTNKEYWDKLRRDVFPNLDNLFADLANKIGFEIRSLTDANKMFEDRLKLHKITKAQLVSYMVENFSKEVTQNTNQPTITRMTEDSFSLLVQALGQQDIERDLQEKRRKEWYR